ncbi:MAG: MG2 domain-containing protein, partial [bacterium]
LILAVQEGLAPDRGSEGMAEPFRYEMPFEAPKGLVVDHVRPTLGEYVSDITIRFSSPVDPEAAESFITIEPAVPHRVSAAGSRLRLSGEFHAGSVYTVRIDEGLRARDGSRLDRPFSRTVRMTDLSPSVDFTHPGTYLARTGLKNVAIEAVNVPGVQVEVEKVYANNLVPFLLRRSRSYWGSSAGELGHPVFSREIPLTLDRNEPATITVDFEEFLSGHPAGLFQVTARNTERMWTGDARRVLLTDIGLIGKMAGDQLHVWALSTQSLEPVPEVEVELLSRSNQTMASGRTDEGGHLLLTGIADRASEFEPYLLRARRGEDMSFLLFSECRVSDADFDVDGRPFLQQGYEAMVYTERGVYRPGETVHTASIVRGPGGTVPPSFPLRLRVVRPDGRILLERQEREPQEGWASFDFPVPDYAPTGRYQAQLLGGEEEPLGTASFRVEEFMPDRMKVEVVSWEPRYAAGDTLDVSVMGTMLFGPPAAGRRLEARFTLEAVPFRPPDHTSFTFGDAQVSFETFTDEVGERRLDHEGRAALPFVIPADLSPPAALEGTVYATVREEGGRAVTGAVSFPVDVYPFYPGLRRPSEGYAEPGRPETIEYVVLTPEGRPRQVDGLQARFYRVRWNTTVQRDSSGRVRFESTRSLEPLETAEISTPDGRGSFTFTPPEWGLYRVRLTHPGSGASAALEFYASGWGYSPWSMDNPDRVDLELDRERYDEGDPVKVLVKAPFAGTLLLTVERERVLHRELHRMEANTAEITLTADRSWFPNAYLTATLVRSIDSAETEAPTRAWGTVPAVMERSRRVLDLDLDVPVTMRPGTTLPVTVRVRAGGAAPPAPGTRLTVAAVDEGILQLTGFSGPDPVEFFYGRKRLDVTTYDVFALLLPEVEESQTYSVPGGDRMEALRQQMLSPASARRVEPVALWSGIVETDAAGTASVPLEVPEDFNGRLRLMAAAASGEQFGSARGEVTVREPIVLTPTLPRFLAPADSIRIPVTVFNGTGREGSVAVSVKAEGAAGIIGPSQVILDLMEGEEGSVSFRARADRSSGRATFTVRARSAAVEVDRVIELPVRPPAPPLVRASAGSASADRPASFTLPGGWMEGSASAVVAVHPLPLVRFSGSLQELLRYPHGCLEQVASRAFPLLYFQDLARVAEPEIFRDRAPEYFVGEAIRRITAQQRSDGAFTTWPRSGVNDWTHVYAHHFLVEADGAGYAVADRVLEGAARHTRSILFGSEEEVRRGVVAASDRRSLMTRAYAAYVLALDGQAQRSAMNFLFESRLESTPLPGRMLLAGAFALSGQTASAFQILPGFLQPVTTDRLTGTTLSSSVRDNAIVLAVLADVSPDHASIPTLVEYLSSEAEAGGWHNTQEDAWAFLALGKILRRVGERGFSGTVTVDGEPAGRLDGGPFALSREDLPGRTVEIHVEGEGTAYWYWRVRGIPIGQDFREEDNGLRIRRLYLDTAGRSVPADSLRHGELYVARLQVSSPNREVENVVIADLLPAGLEIENPRLASREVLPDDRQAARPDYMDIRDDRILLYTDLEQGEAKRFYYSVRAVTAGDFLLPPVWAECMYDPGLNSVSGSGSLRVLRR